MKYITVDDAIKTTWMVLEGIGYKPDENPKLKSDVDEVFSTAPVLDIQLDPKGIWMWDSIPYVDMDGVSRGGIFGYRCSECGGISTFNSKYCPNCGVEMEIPYG